MNRDLVMKYLNSGGQKEENLKEFAREVRKDIIKMIHNAKSGHPGGGFSCVDILSVLYKKILFVPVDWDKSLDFKNRDRFILSKGHASTALYGVLANLGYFSKDFLTKSHISANDFSPTFPRILRAVLSPIPFQP